MDGTQHHGIDPEADSRRDNCLQSRGALVAPDRTQADCLSEVPSRADRHRRGVVLSGERFGSQLNARRDLIFCALAWVPHRTSAVAASYLGTGTRPRAPRAAAVAVFCAIGGRVRAGSIRAGAAMLRGKAAGFGPQGRRVRLPCSVRLIAGTPPPEQPGFSGDLTRLDGFAVIRTRSERRGGARALVFDYGAGFWRRGGGFAPAANPRASGLAPALGRDARAFGSRRARLSVVDSTGSTRPTPFVRATRGKRFGRGAGLCRQSQDALVWGKLLESPGKQQATGGACAAAADLQACPRRRHLIVGSLGPTARYTVIASARRHKREGGRTLAKS